MEAFRAVLIAFGRRQRSDQPFVAEMNRLEQRRVYPPLQLGIVSRIRLVPPSRTLAAHPVVNRVDAGRRGDQLLGVAERDRQHRADGRAQPADARQRAAAEAAVVVHAGGDRGMRQLEQDGAAPAGDHDDLAVDLPGDASRAGAPVVRSEEARTYRPRDGVEVNRR